MSQVTPAITTLCILLLSFTHILGAADGESRRQSNTPFSPYRDPTSLLGPRAHNYHYITAKRQGHHNHNPLYLRPHLGDYLDGSLPYQWENGSYKHPHHTPNHQNHHYSHHMHHWKADNGMGGDREMADGRNVNGERMGGRLSVLHHHKQKRQRQIQEEHMKGRRSNVYSSKKRGMGGYAFRVEERSGVRRVIAVREAVRGRGSRAVVDSGGSGSGINNVLDGTQDDTSLASPPGPSFDRNLPRNITMQTGQTAVLSCRVFNVNDKSVSWIRQDNLHILTVDKYKYSTDQRVSVVFNEPNLEWVLRIKSVTPEDAGTYECQVSTKPILSFVVNMSVVVPRAWILNAPEIYVHRGSPINLTCVVKHGTERPVFIYWYHHDHVIDYEGRDGVRVHTQNARDTVSHLLVKEAGRGDNGRYTCSPSNGEPASVMLHVLNGEQPAAMQTNGSTSSGEPQGCVSHVLLPLTLLHALTPPYWWYMWTL